METSSHMFGETTTGLNEEVQFGWNEVQFGCMRKRWSFFYWLVFLLLETLVFLLLDFLCDTDVGLS